MRLAATEEPAATKGPAVSKDSAATVTKETSQASYYRQLPHPRLTRDNAGGMGIPRDYWDTGYGMPGSGMRDTHYALLPARCMLTTALLPAQQIVVGEELGADSIKNDAQIASAQAAPQPAQCTTTAIELLKSVQFNTAALRQSQPSL